ncbi:MAG: hypothetical protein MJ239_01670 [Bacilli bacterium]|nr:hypothetical protein [Bacilli bacterium]
MFKKSILGIAALSLIAVSLIIPGVKGLSAEEGVEYVILDDSTFADSYDFGYLLEAPSIEKLYFEKDGVMNKVTYGEVTLPNGVTRVPGKFSLDIPGQYKVAYYAKGGASFKKEFVVRKTVYENGNGVTSYFENSMPVSAKKGIAVNLVSGSSFKINKVVDIHSFKNGLVDVVNYYPIFRKTKDQIPAASFCTVKLVDAYNPDHFLEFYTWCDKSAIPYYAGVGSSEQNFTGLEYNPNRPDKINCVYEGVSYNKHVTTRYQVVDAYGVWGGMMDEATLIRENGVSYSWDLNDNKTYFIGKDTNKLITDLDAPEVYDSNPLDVESFFTTGEVYAQFECFGFNSGSMDIEIVSVLGMKGDELKDAIVYDEKAPTIKTDFMEEGKESVTVSKDEKFYIPSDVTVLDYNYYGDLKTNVYLNYGQPDQSSVYSSDYFVPTVLGNYSLVYTARDSFGNVSKKVVSLNCVDKKPFTFEEKKVAKLDAAAPNDIPFLEVAGHNGDVSIKAYAIDPKGEVTPLGLNESKTAYSFVPLYTGEYEISYEISDAFYSTSYSYKVNSEDIGNVYFAKAPAVYPYYIKGASYSLNDFVGVKATANGPVEVKTTPSVSFDGGAFSVVSNPRKIDITGSSSVKFKFSAGGVEYTSDEIKILDLKFGKRSVERNYVDYFQGNFEAKSEELSSLRYEFGASGNMTFANVISFSNFAFNFDFEASNANSIEVVLSDYQDRGNYISVFIEKMTSLTFKATIVQNDGKFETKQSGYFNLSGSSESINILVQSGKLFVNDYVSMEVEHNFELSRLDVMTNGATAIDVKKINNQNVLKAAKMIETGPQSYYDKKTGSFEIGSDYSAAPCVASSVLSPVLADDIRLTITDSSGEVVTSLDGIRLDSVLADRQYDINLAKCGQYRVNYVVSCEGSSRSGGEKIVNDKDYYIVNVDDTVPPVVTFADRSTLEVEVHSVVRIRSFTVSDNNSDPSKIKTYVVIEDYNGTISESGFNVGETYAFHKVGTFKVSVYAYDEYGNWSSDSYTVIVRA